METVLALTQKPAKAVLGEYSHVRRPRTQMVSERTLRAGKAYDQNGPYGPTSAGIRKDLENIHGPVWHHDTDDDVHDIVQALRERGVFPPGQ